jgi:hypothetical protein
VVAAYTGHPCAGHIPAATADLSMLTLADFGKDLSDLSKANVHADADNLPKSGVQGVAYLCRLVQLLPACVPASWRCYQRAAACLTKLRLALCACVLVTPHEAWVGLGRASVLLCCGGSISQTAYEPAVWHALWLAAASQRAAEALVLL